jgi:hypothetical protein
MERRRLKVRDGRCSFVGDQILAKACNVFGYDVGSSIVVGIVKGVVGCKE